MTDRKNDNCFNVDNLQLWTNEFFFFFFLKKFFSHKNKKKSFKSILEPIRFHAFLHFATSQNGTDRHSIYAIILRRNRVPSAFHSISINCKKFQGRQPRFCFLLIPSCIRFDYVYIAYLDFLP